MRALLVAALLGLGVAAAQPACAAGLAESPGDFSGAIQYGGGAFGNFRAEPVLIYDYQPGVIARAWWLSPWHNRHYFPTTGKRPRVGRLENLSAKSRLIRPAGTFYRAWSTSELFFDEAPRLRARDADSIPPRRKAPAQP